MNHLPDLHSLSLSLKSNNDYVLCLTKQVYWGAIWTSSFLWIWARGIKTDFSYSSTWIESHHKGGFWYSGKMCIVAIKNNHPWNPHNKHRWKHVKWQWRMGMLLLYCIHVYIDLISVYVCGITCFHSKTFGGTVEYERYVWGPKLV